MKTSPFEIIQSLQLEYYLKDVLLNNDSNKLPYHNLNHTLCVLKNCYYLSLEYTIDPGDKRLLCIAALYQRPHRSTEDNQGC